MDKTQTETSIQPANNQSKQLKVDYIKYEDLAPYEEKTNFLELFRTISTNFLETPEFKWEIHFNTINELRRLRKHSKELFYTIVKDYKLCKEIFPNYINSIRSNLSKITLMLITELFSEFEYENLNKWVTHLIPEVLNKSADNKIFLREEAMRSLQNLSENMFYEESIICLLNGVKSNNSKISQNSFETLIKLIENYDKVNLENISEWKEIYKHISDIFLLKDDRHVKKSEKIVGVIKEKLTNGIFDKVLKIASKNTVLIINQIFHPKQVKPNKTKESLKDFKNRMLNDQTNKENFFQKTTITTENSNTIKRE
jgi:hypothetical protein